MLSQRSRYLWTLTQHYNLTDRGLRLRFGPEEEKLPGSVWRFDCSPPALIREQEVKVSAPLHTVCVGGCEEAQQEQEPPFAPAGGSLILTFCSFWRKLRPRLLLLQVHTQRLSPSRPTQPLSVLSGFLCLPTKHDLRGCGTGRSGPPLTANNLNLNAYEPLASGEHYRHEELK